MLAVKKRSYSVAVRETLVYRVEVEAESEDCALIAAEEKVFNWPQSDERAHHAVGDAEYDCLID